MTWVILLILVTPISIFQWILFKDLVGCCKVKGVERNQRKETSQIRYNRRKTEKLRAVK